MIIIWIINIMKENIHSKKNTNRERVIFLPILFILIAFIFYRKKSGLDRPRYFIFFKFFSAVGDFFTDAIWAFILTFGPYTLSIIIGMILSKKWRQTKSKSNTKCNINIGYIIYCYVHKMHII